MNPTKLMLAVARGRAAVHTTKRQDEGRDDLKCVLVDLLAYAENSNTDFDTALAHARMDLAELKNKEINVD